MTFAGWTALSTVIGLAPVAIPFVWLGAVVGISFLETPLKFQAPRLRDGHPRRGSAFRWAARPLHGDRPPGPGATTREPGRFIMRRGAGSVVVRFLSQSG